MLLVRFRRRLDKALRGTILTASLSRSGWFPCSLAVSELHEDRVALGE